ncbi:hypothetical protein PRECH8_04840 [Insulibacter thermoxylanivorax]|uniref:Uncharacterized protein n=1 Tax=Insulibacter thermoxylanivorax TaxID=2749268 RepID=A0A916QDQ4_9BACL|nr:DNA modification system-associated small protein [Insulibacter thermoxylanivorax]GFR37188.1 hypothetical protein PRECH8_04840 [Insulibacter thermoxylanivorax]
MKNLGQEESRILADLCNTYNIKPEYLHTLIQIKREYSYKSSARANELRKEIENHIQVWAKSYDG